MPRHLSREQRKEVDHILERVYILKSLTEQVDEYTQHIKELNPRKVAIRAELKGLIKSLQNLEFNL
jgi:hypothetical protein